MKRRRPIRFAHLVVAIALPLLAACGTGGVPTHAPVDGDVVVPPTTKVLDTQSGASLLAFDADGTLRFRDASLHEFLEAGDVVVSAPVEAAPAGLLRRVVTVRDDAGQLVVETEPAQLQDAVLQGEVEASGDLGSFRLAADESGRAGLELLAPSNLSVPLPPIDVIVADADGDPSTTDDQVRVTGTAGFDVGYALGLGFKTDVDLDWSPVEIQTRIHAAFHVTQSTDLTVVAGAATHFEKDVELATVPLPTIVLMLGPVPVVIVPSIQLRLFADGHVGTSVSFGASEQLAMTVGLDKPYGGGFSPIASLVPSASAHTPDIEPSQYGASFDAGAGLEVRGAMKFYGVAGPFVSVKPEIRLRGSIPGDPAWKIEGAVRGEVGLWVDALVFDYDWSAEVFGESFPIAEATGNSAPAILSFTATPYDHKSYQVALPITLSTVSADVEDGQILGGSYHSDVDGPLTRDASNRVIFSTPGVRHVTVTVTDSDGATAQATLTLNVVNTAPKVTIGRPKVGEVVYRGVPVVLAGSTSDPNEAGGTVPCWATAWTSSNPNDVMPASKCGDVITVTFQTLGQRTLTLAAYDLHGAVGTATVTINVVNAPAGNVAPTATIVTPSQHGSFNDLHGLSVAGRAYDPDNTGLIYRWTILWDGGSAIIEEGVVTGTNQPGGALLEAFWDPYLACRSTMILRLELSDGAEIGVDERTLSCMPLPR